MPKPEPLPAAIHDHFRKANVLHGYVEKSLGDATKHALETGEELLAAKTAIPHGRWEQECKRLFDGSLTTARFYMQFAKHVSSLPKQRATGVLLLESTLEGAARAARQAARPSPPKAPKREEVEAPDDTDADPFLDDGTEPEPEETSSRPPGKGREAPAGKQFDGGYWLKQWTQAIGPVCRLVDKIAHGVGQPNGKEHKCIVEHLDLATEEMAEWMG